MNIYVMAWRNVRRNNRRTLLSASAIGIAALTLVLLFSLLAGMKQELEFNIQTFYTGEIRIRHSEYDQFAHLNPLHLSVSNSDELIALLQDDPMIEHASARIPFPSSIYRDGDNIAAFGLGIDVNDDLMLTKSYLVEGRMPEPGKTEVVLGLKLSTELGLALGNKFTAITMTMRRASNGMTFRVVGIANFPLSELNGSYYTSVDTAQRFLKMGDNAVDIVIKSSAGTDTELARDRVAQILSDLEIPSVKVEIWNNISATYALIKMASLVYNIMGLVFYLLASTVIINTMMMVVFERTKEIGTLASLGMEGSAIVKTFFVEAVYISVLGSFIGTFLGAIITLVLQETGIDMSAAMEGVDFEISGIFYPKLTLFNMLYAFVSGVVVASLASLIPSRRAAKIRPVEAMKSL